MWDIVYFVKDTQVNEELRHSLRSLKNFPHNKVWFYGGCPDGLKPDYHIEVEQDQPTKWQNIFKMFKLACSNKDITKNFWLFNDDFFVMKPINYETNYYCRVYLSCWLYGVIPLCLSSSVTTLLYRSPQ